MEAAAGHRGCPAGPVAPRRHCHRHRCYVTRGACWKKHGRTLHFAAAGARARGLDHCHGVSRRSPDLSAGRPFNRTSRRLAVPTTASMLRRTSNEDLASERSRAWIRSPVDLEPTARSRKTSRTSVLRRPLGRPAMPEFFRTYTDISVDLHLTDAHADLIGDGFDAALRGYLDDCRFSRVRFHLTRSVRRASPTYLSRYGRPQHPQDLGVHQCLTYANRSKRDVWRFTHKNARSIRSRRQALYAEQAWRRCCPRSSQALR